MLERLLERFLFSSRWLLAPFYAGLVLSLVVLLIKALQELAHFVLHAFSASEADVILGVLTLVDLTCESWDLINRTVSDRVLSGVAGMPARRWLSAW